MAQAEKTIPKPLSGLEVVDAILHGIKRSIRREASKVPIKVGDEILSRFKAQLKKDCYLNPCIAYAIYQSETDLRIQYQSKNNDAFTFQATSKVSFPATGTNIKNTVIALNGRCGEFLSETEIEAVDVKAIDIPRPPNEVRLETGQDIPAIVRKPSGGIEERKLKYAQPPAKQAPPAKGRKVSA